MTKRTIALSGAAAAILIATGIVLVGCNASDTPAEPNETTVPVTTDTPEATTPVTEPEATPTEAPEPEIVADEFSQVVNGVLYQGTEKAPVRIGTDTPGAAPAAEAPFLAAGREGSMDRAEASGKYLVYVFQGEGGWAWKVFGTDRFGSFREIADNGYSYRQYIPTRDEAIAGPFIVDGRALDRAEYILAAD